MDDENEGGAMVPIWALAYEHHEDPEMRPYGARPISGCCVMRYRCIVVWGCARGGAPNFTAI